jgi:hypothetical protein
MKQLVTLTLLLTALPACAQGWVRYTQTDEAILYFDSLRTRKMGDTAFVWDLHDLKTESRDVQGKAYRSALFATEYQCRARKHRWLGVTRHAEPMAAGAAVAEETGAGEWVETRPDSLAGQLFKHICE